MITDEGLTKLRSEFVAKASRTERQELILTLLDMVDKSIHEDDPTKVNVVDLVALRLLLELMKKERSETKGIWSKFRGWKFTHG